MKTKDEKISRNNKLTQLNKLLSCRKDERKKNNINF